MAVQIDLKPVLEFLGGLRANNEKHWFDAHRAEYQDARGRFEYLIDGLIEEFREPDDLEDLSAGNCIARINRDLRFSRDPSPYKTNFGALIARGGWRSRAFGYYLSVEPGGLSMVAGGLHSPTPPQLDAFRRAIAADSEPFRRVIEQRAFVEAFGAPEGERLKTAPRGYDPAHPDIEFLRLKQVLVMRRLADKEVLAPGYADQVISLCRAMRPFLDYLAAVTREVAA